MSAPKVLAGIEMHGSEQSKRTGWRRWPAFTLLRYTDGSTQYLNECGLDQALKASRLRGDNTADYEAKLAAAAKVQGYPPKPDCELYLHNYGYQKPTQLGEWQWSSTFGRWGRIVTFADGWHGYTFPQHTQPGGQS